jgi:K+ transporter
VQYILSFVAKYWKGILIGLLVLVVGTFWRNDHSSLIKAFDAASVRYEQEMAILKESHTRELQRKKDLIEEHEKALQVLQRDYEETKEKIESLKSDRVKEVTALRSEDPSALAEQIEEAFGFEYVE